MISVMQKSVYWNRHPWQKLPQLDPPMAHVHLPFCINQMGLIDSGKAVDLPPNSEPDKHDLSILPAIHSPSTSTQPSVAEKAPQSTEECIRICKSFIDQIRSASAPGMFQRIYNTNWTMPTDPSEFSYWMAHVNNHLPSVYYIACPLT